MSLLGCTHAQAHSHALRRLAVPRAAAPASCLPLLSQVAAAYLLADMADADSPQAPYWAVMPPRADVATFYDLPPAYLPLVQNTATV